MKRLMDVAGLAALFALVATNAYATQVPPTPVPEPTTMALVAAGVAGLVAARHLRKRK